MSSIPIPPIVELPQENFNDTLGVVLVCGFIAAVSVNSHDLQLETLRVDIFAGFTGLRMFRYTSITTDTRTIVLS